MLALKANRISLRLSTAAAAAQYGSLCSNKCAAVSSLSITDCWMGSSKQQSVKVPCYLANHYAFAPLALTATRFYADRPPANPPESSPPSQYGLPDKQQMEKYFFRTIALLWDFSIWAYNLSMRSFNKYVIKNPTVQIYWSKFVEKVENARKN